LLGSALRGTGAIERAVELLKRAQKEYPGDLWINEDLGYLCTFEIWPRRYADGVRFTTAALALRPRNDHLLCTLSSAFSGLGQSDEAIAVCRRIIERSPDLPDGHASLGVILAGKGWLDEAEVEMRQVVRLNPRNAGNHFNLGKTLRNTRKRREAAAELREAIKIWPDFPGAYCELGLVLLEQGQFKEALAALRRGHDLGTKSPNWPYSSSGWVRMAERMVELDSKLEGYLSGRTTPANAYEREELGQLCYFKGLGQAAVRFYKEAFGAAPQPAEIKTSEHRYIAARAAALAGSGQGNDAGNLDLGERARFRREALDWLRADLAACEKYAEGKTDEVRANVQGRMRHWKLDPEFARMRGPDTLTELPEEERRSWQQFWEHVEALLRRTADEKK
jgi:serine/threonine-protein kinase